MSGFSILTLGCKVNQYESAAISLALKSAGWTQISPAKDPAVCIVNTCTVTRKAAQQSRQTIRRISRMNPAANIIVTGCLAQTEVDRIRNISGIHAIVGHGDKYRIPEIIRSADSGGFEQPPLVVWRDAASENRFQDMGQAVIEGRTRPFLKIQDGCNAFCTYCIVPYARGPSRSLPVEKVIGHTASLDRAGYREIVLTGIHLGAYGLDLDPKKSLFDLLGALDTQRPAGRIRLSSLEPGELTHEIIEMTAASDLLCRHFHIPLQSGDDRILQRMHRPYTQAFFEDLVLHIHDRMPDAAVGVDVLTGFPGETEAAFEHTCRLIEKLPLAYLHVFQFSGREGTPAEKYADQVPAAVKKRRSETIRNIGYKKKLEFYNTFINKIVEVLVEGSSSDRRGLYKGLSDNYIPVYFNGRRDMLNKMVRCRIERLDPCGFLIGDAI